MIGLFGGQITSHFQSVIFSGEPIDEVERRLLAQGSIASTGSRRPQRSEADQ